MKIIDRGMKGVKRCDVMDFAFFKICIFTLGVLTGVYFFKFFRRKEGMLWGIFGTTWIYTLCKAFGPDKYEKAVRKCSKKLKF